jgi:hypothetical protein
MDYASGVLIEEHASSFLARAGRSAAVWTAWRIETEGISR